MSKMAAPPTAEGRSDGATAPERRSAAIGAGRRSATGRRGRRAVSSAGTAVRRPRIPSPPTRSSSGLRRLVPARRRAFRRARRSPAAAHAVAARRAARRDRPGRRGARRRYRRRRAARCACRARPRCRRDRASEAPRPDVRAADSRISTARVPRSSSGTRSSICASRVPRSQRAAGSCSPGRGPRGRDAEHGEPAGAGLRRPLAGPGHAPPPGPRPGARVDRERCGAAGLRGRTGSSVRGGQARVRLAPRAGRFAPGHPDLYDAIRRPEARERAAVRGAAAAALSRQPRSSSRSPRPRRWSRQRLAGAASSTWRRGVSERAGGQGRGRDARAERGADDRAARRRRSRAIGSTR